MKQLLPRLHPICYSMLRSIYLYLFYSTSTEWRNIHILGIPIDLTGIKARPDAKPVGFTVYLSTIVITLSVYSVNAMPVNNVLIEQHLILLFVS